MLLPPQVSASKLADAHGRIEALIDEKADLEYDLEVLQRQVELLKEQVRGSDANPFQYVSGNSDDVPCCSARWSCSTSNWVVGRPGKLFAC